MTRLQPTTNTAVLWTAVLVVSFTILTILRIVSIAVHCLINTIRGWCLGCLEVKYQHFRVVVLYTLKEWYKNICYSQLRIWRRIR